MGSTERLSRSPRGARRWLPALLLCASCLACAEPPVKTLRLALAHAESGFDPAMAGEVYSAAVIAAIMEPLLTYDYLARPPRLMPLTAAALPEVTDGGRTYTFRIKPGIWFADDPAFRGRRRELVADDYAFAIKRLVDPALRSPNAFLVKDRIAGLAHLAGGANAVFDYGAPVAGLEVLDRHTLRIRLVRSDYTFAHVMAMPTLSAVAREVADAYPDRLAAHPVGTGPFVLRAWVPASRITLAANPRFREVRWEFAPGEDAQDRPIVATMRGKRVPQMDVVEFHVVEEARSAWLAFVNGELDIIGVPDALASLALDGDRLTPSLQARGVHLSRRLATYIAYTAFNMRDPMLGGHSREKVALRRAIAMAFSVAQEIAVIRKGQAISLEMPIPPDISGHVAGYRSRIGHDVALANRLLDRAGYARGLDGLRRLPDGGPLVVRYATQRDATAREYDELWTKAFASLGIRFETDYGNYGDQVKAAIGCRHQMFSYGWAADYPDGDNFMQLLHGANIHQTNVACYASPAYDALYESSRLLPDSPERTRLFERMSRVAENEVPWILHGLAYSNVLAAPRVKGFKSHPFLLNDWMYADVEPLPAR